MHRHTAFTPRRGCVRTHVGSSAPCPCDSLTPALVRVDHSEPVSTSEQWRQDLLEQVLRDHSWPEADAQGTAALLTGARALCDFRFDSTHSACFVGDARRPAMTEGQSLACGSLQSGESRKTQSGNTASNTGARDRVAESSRD